MRYQVWRYHKLVAEGNFRVIKTWMLNNLPSYHYEEVLAARRAYTKNYPIARFTGKGNTRLALNWIAVDSEYCSIKQIKD